MKVLAFTTSRGRPFFLRACLLQMAAQTYGVDHVVYANHTDTSPAFDYRSLIHDIKSLKGGRLFMRTGPSLWPHFNHISALKLVAIEDYDLFLKIDDDDIYRSTYVEEVVNSFKTHQWDFSGSFSDGLLNKAEWHPNDRYNSLGLSEKDKALGVMPMMPPTFAFSRRAIEAILQLDLNTVEDPARFEDVIWRQFLTESGHFKIFFRENSEFTYHIHDKNFCVSMLKSAY